MDNMKNYFCSPAMDRLLSQHILRVDEMPHVGLYGGKLGLIILLYHYAHFNRNKPYKELADRLMESSLRTFHIDFPMDCPVSVGGFCT